MFSLAPVLVIAIAVAGALFGQEAAQGEIVGQIRGLVGEEGATAIQSLIQSASRQGAGSSATWDMVRARVLSFASVLGTGFLLSVSLVLSAAVAALGRVGWR